MIELKAGKKMFFPDRLEDIIPIIEAGGIIIYPTDTIWGIGGDAFNLETIRKINHIKKRPKTQNYILLVSSIEMLKKYVDRIHPRVETLLSIHKKPLTIVYPKAKNLPAHLVAENGSVAIRVIQEEFCKSLIERFGRPLISTSANFSGEPFPKNFEEINQKLLTKVDYIVKYRQSEKYLNDPSVIASYNHKGEFIFLRD